MIFGFCDQQAGDQCADDWREADCGGGKARADNDQQRGRKEQLGTLCACCLSEQAGEGKATEHHHRNDYQAALPQRGQHAFPAFARGIGGHGTEDEDNRDDHDVLEQQHG